MSRRRRRSHRGHTDSLDLLLGPMCNTFGGIVLMAVVMALLSREVDVKALARSGGSGDNAELLARRIAKAEDDLARARQFEASLDERAKDPLVAEQMRLALERQRLREQLGALQRAPRDSPAAAPQSDPGLLANELHAELAVLVREKVERENARAALEENLERLHRRDEELAAQMQAEKDKSVRKLRLPKERANTKNPFFVIVRYGQVFPRAVFHGGEMVENDVTIKRTAKGEDGMLMEPLAGRGFDPGSNKSGLDAVLRGVPGGGYYLAFVVYEDSFPAFNTVKQRASELGLDYGWDAFPNDRPLIFTKSGREAAPPL